MLYVCVVCMCVCVCVCCVHTIIYVTTLCIYIYIILHSNGYCRSGPCKQMAPKFYELSMKYLAVVFIKLDVEICRVRETVYRTLVATKLAHKGASVLYPHSQPSD